MERNVRYIGVVKAVVRVNRIRRLLAILLYPAFIAAVGGTLIPVVGFRDAIGISAAAMAWFVFGRLLLNTILAAVLRGVSRSHRLPMLLGSFIVDGAGCLAAIDLDRRLLLSALLAIAVTELTIWSMEFLPEDASVPITR